tara:strand:+ start:438 stop:917 length:480 start_codon:yes stop_codon:yes gene_type:complete
MLKKIVTIFSFCLAVFAWSSITHAADEYVKAGILKCIKSGKKINILIHSQFPIKCIFEDASGGKEKYTGKSGIELGLDLEKLKKARMHFAVLAIGNLKAGDKALLGKYIGAKVNVSLGLGGGVDALVGGGSSHIALQPIALEATKGFGAAAGVGFLELH